MRCVRTDTATALATWLVSGGCRPQSVGVLAIPGTCAQELGWWATRVAMTQMSRSACDGMTWMSCVWCYAVRVHSVIRAWLVRDTGGAGCQINYPRVP